MQQYLEAVLIRVEGGGLLPILDTRLQPHEEIDVVVVDAVAEAEVVLYVDAFGLGLSLGMVETNRVDKRAWLRGIVLTACKREREKKTLYSYILHSNFGPMHYS